MNYRKVKSSISEGQHSSRIYPAAPGTQNLGHLKVRTVTPGLSPVSGVRVTISPAASPDTILEEVITDASGLTPEVSLPAPSPDYSQEPSAMQPYSEYTIRISSPGCPGVMVQNTEVFPDTLALLPTVITPESGETDILYHVPSHVLSGDYPPKIAESEVKTTEEGKEIITGSIVIPEFIVVHDGFPTDQTAANHPVRFRDYIKNIASGESYPTWSEETLTAVVLAILSFTLNRVCTEWYRDQGFPFTVTSSSAFDHKWVPGRNIYENISRIVDRMFTNYLSRPGIQQPILIQYCDGRNIPCPSWMPLWEAKKLGDQGRTAMEILRNYYGNSIYLNGTAEVSGAPYLWPGSDLCLNSSGAYVRILQEQLNRISDAYGIIPKTTADGWYSSRTMDAVQVFQQLFDLAPTGNTDMATWYKLSGIYTAIVRAAK